MSAPFKPKQLVKIPVTHRLPRWMVEWMRDQVDSGNVKSMAVLIEEALTEKHGIEPPKPKKGAQK